MTAFLVQLKVKDYGDWKKGFDASAPLRKASGGLSHQVFRDVSDSNKITVLNTWDSLENAQKFALSPELREAQEKAGVIGAPEVSFLSEA